MADLKKVADQLVSLTVKEVNELADILKEDHGIEPAAAAAVTVSGGPAAGEDSAAEAKTEFDVILKSAGGSKLAADKYRASRVKKAVRGESKFGGVVGMPSLGDLLKKK